MRSLLVFYSELEEKSQIKEIFTARGVDLTLRDLLVLAESRHQAQLSNKDCSRNVYQQLLLLLLV